MNLPKLRTRLPRWLPWAGVAAAALSAGLWLASPYLFPKGHAAEPQDRTAKAEDKQPPAQARGEKVGVVLQQANQAQPGTMTGTLIGVEAQTHQVGKDATVQVEVLNLWCADGIRSCKLSEVQRLRFLNPGIDSEFRKALETLALSHDTQKKPVSIAFSGEGKRRVRVGYVVESPIWKTSYRLVLDKQAKTAPYLQGWAVVENTTDEAWKDVRMALVSGRPISFQMNLYDPLFINRPIIEPELFASLRPVAYSGAMEPKRAVMISDAVNEGS